MEERKNLFETVREVIGEIEQLRNENKCLKEEINNREFARMECDAYIKKLLKERKQLREEIDNKEEIIQSWADDYNSLCECNKRLVAERKHLLQEMEEMVKDHVKEMEDAEKELHGISFTTLNMFEINDTITEFMRVDRGSCLSAKETVMFFELAEKFAACIDRKKELL